MDKKSLSECGLRDCVRNLLLFSGFTLFVFLLTRNTELIDRGPTALRISDFAYYIEVIKAFWFANLDSPYSLSSQQQVMSEIAGQAVNAMPLNITPIAFVVWFPFAWIAQTHLSLAHVLWTAFSLTILSSGLIGTFQLVQHSSSQQRLRWLALSIVTCGSTSMFTAIWLGQTSIIGTGLLLHLLRLFSKEGTSPRDELLIILIIFLLSIKPQYAVFAFTTAIFFRRYRLTAMALGVLLGTCALLTPILGHGWIREYLASLSSVANYRMAVAYQQSVALSTMTIFKSAFGMQLGIQFASTISIAVSILGVLLPLTLHFTKSSPLRFSPNTLLAIIFSTYLLFSPHAGYYEDLLLLVLVSLAISPLSATTGSRLWSLDALLCFVVVNHRLFSSPSTLWIFWVAKVLLCVHLTISIAAEKKQN